MLKKALKRVVLFQACVVIMYMVYLNIPIHNSYKTTTITPWINTTTLEGTLRVVDQFETFQRIEHVLPYNVTVVSQTCKNMTLPRLTATDAQWMPVSKERQSFVYSAFHVINNGNKVVIIGTKNSAARVVICQLWTRKDNSGNIHMSEVVASARALPESHGKKYYAAVFECKLDSVHVPSYISMVTTKCGVPKHLLVVQAATKPPKYSRNFTVCLPPLNLQYSNTFALIEWIELNTILGANKFIVYNNSISSNVSRVLDYFSRKGMVDVLPWKLPMSVRLFKGDNRTHEIHYFGQVAALNDCLYRNKYLSEFVVNLDLDEFIVPHPAKLQTWYDVVNRTQVRKSAYLFSNTFFKVEWETNNTLTSARNLSLVQKYKLVTLQKIQHERKIFAHKQRSKYIARTSDVFQLMIHEVPRVKCDNVPANTALLHHYRYWGGLTKVPEYVKVRDDTVPAKYGDQLISRVSQTWNNLKNVNVMRATFA